MPLFARGNDKHQVSVADSILKVARTLMEKKDFELSKKYFYQGTEELDFEETSEKYRFFCAMMQSDDWELLQSKNKKSETAEK